MVVAIKSSLKIAVLVVIGCYEGEDFFLSGHSHFV